MLYSFKLGRNKELSIAEIAAVFTEKKVEEMIDNHLIVHTGEQLNQQSIDRLGGTIKISQIVAECEKADLAAKISEAVLKHCDIDSKITYAINIEPITYKSKKLLKSLLIETKKTLKTEGAKVRFMNKFNRDEAKNIENIQSKKEILDKDNSIEINIIQKSDTLYMVSFLVASQDIDGYSKRDYEKPCRDAINGMLPPKLSQILINLSLAGMHHVDPKNITIVDPFCGSGSLLIEALLMGFHATGSDINPKMISDSKMNVDWLRKNYGVHKKQDCIVFPHDATERLPKAKRMALIATEGYLGDPMTVYPSEEEIKRNFEIITSLYADFFKNLWHMHDKVTIAICIPNYIKKHQSREPKDLLERIKRLGFKQVPLISRNLTPKINPGKKGDVLSYLYSRPDQIVGRRIHVFQK
ncbi:MAG: hypothetical protein Q8P68_01880 [Candidatus Peregrinibacteria bacterium]|nr:hypothetical protein [Candidatus Peregrinibacteria bacterium]MDZ4244510.1 hypothetical protein [Candidatus Gracilibacteria bacterium]